MAKTLELQGMSLQEINSGNAVLKAALENPDPQVQLTIANSLWAHLDFPFLFIDNVKHKTQGYFILDIRDVC
jgi:serine protease inhibitor